LAPIRRNAICSFLSAASPRSYDGVLRSPGYPSETVIRKVRRNGEIKWKGNCILVSEVLIPRSADIDP